MDHLKDVIVHEIYRPGLPGDGATVTEVQAFRAELNSYRDRPYVDHLDDLVPGATENQVPVKQADGSWAPVPRLIGLPTLTDGTDTRSNVTKLIAGPGIDVSAGGNVGEGTMQVAFGGTGDATTAAKSDHTHNPAIVRTFPFTATPADLSGGSRTLLSFTIPDMDQNANYEIDLEMKGDVRNQINAGRVLPILQIAWENAVPRFDSMRTVGGVTIEYSHAYSTYLPGGAHTVTASIQYVDGDRTFIGKGVVIVRAWPRR